MWRVGKSRLTFKKEHFGQVALNLEHEEMTPTVELGFANFRSSSEETLVAAI